MIPVRGEPSPDSLASASMVEAHSIAPVKTGIFPPAASELVELWHAAIWGLPVGPMTRQQLESRALDGSISLRTYVWREGMATWERITEVDALAALVPLLGEPASPPTIPPSTRALAEDSTQHESVQQSASGETERKSPIALAFALLSAVLLGTAMGFAIFGGQETEIVKEIVEVPSAVVVVERDSNEKETAPEPTVQVAPRAPVVRKKKSSTKSLAVTRAIEEEGEEAPLPAEVEKLPGLSGLSDFGGPGSGDHSPASGVAMPLSDAQIQETVSRGQAGVKRGCWERALMTRDLSAPSSARVMIAITVSPEGQVNGASGGVDPTGYPGLASCVAGRVLAWSFPPSSGTTTVNVPFVFAAQ